jgi:hypothetical protein
MFGDSHVSILGRSSSNPLQENYDLHLTPAAHIDEKTSSKEKYVFLSSEDKDSLKFKSIIANSVRKSFLKKDIASSSNEFSPAQPGTPRNDRALRIVGIRDYHLPTVQAGFRSRLRAAIPTSDVLVRRGDVVRKKENG